MRQPRPPVLLADVGGQVLGAEPMGQHFGHVRRPPSPLVQVDGELEVLGERPLREATDRLERVAAEHDVRAAAEHRVVGLLPAGDRAEEQRLLPPRGGRQRVRPRRVVAVHVVLRGLHEGDLRVGEAGQRSLQERGLGHVIAVEHDDEWRVGAGQRVVDVARLCALVQGATDVASSVPVGERFHLRPVAVVEQGNADLRAPQGDRRRHRWLDRLDRLVVRRDEDVDDRVVVEHDILSARRRGRPPVTAPGHDAGPPEADCLDDVEQFSDNEHAEQHGMADALRAQQPRQVPGDEQRATGGQQRGAPPGGGSGRAGVPGARRRRTSSRGGLAPCRSSAGTSLIATPTPARSGAGSGR